MSQQGQVVSVRGGVAQEASLPSAMLGERVIVRGHTAGVVLSLDEHLTHVGLLGEASAGDAVTGTGALYAVKSGERALGGEVDVGERVDEGRRLHAAPRRPVEGIDQRPWATGQFFADARLPMTLGDRLSVSAPTPLGAHDAAVGVMLQRATGGVCVHAAFGEAASVASDLDDELGEQIERVVRVRGGRGTSTGALVEALGACAIADGLADGGRDVLLVIEGACALVEQVSSLDEALGQRGAATVARLLSRLEGAAFSRPPTERGGSLSLLLTVQSDAHGQLGEAATTVARRCNAQLSLVEAEGGGLAPSLERFKPGSGSMGRPRVVRKLLMQLGLELAAAGELAKADASSRPKNATDAMVQAVLRQRVREPLSLAEQAALCFAMQEGLFAGTAPSQIAASFGAVARALRERSAKVIDAVSTEKDLSDALKGQLRSALRDAIAASQGG